MNIMISWTILYLGLSKCFSHCCGRCKMIVWPKLVSIERFLDHSCMVCWHWPVWIPKIAHMAHIKVIMLCMAISSNWFQGSKVHRHAAQVLAHISCPCATKTSWQWLHASDCSIHRCKWVSDFTIQCNWVLTEACSSGTITAYTSRYFAWSRPCDPECWTRWASSRATGWIVCHPARTRVGGSCGITNSYAAGGGPYRQHGRDCQHECVGAYPFAGVQALPRKLSAGFGREPVVGVSCLISLGWKDVLMLPLKCIISLHMFVIRRHYRFRISLEL